MKFVLRQSLASLHRPPTIHLTIYGSASVEDAEDRDLATPKSFVFEELKVPFVVSRQKARKEIHRG